MKQLDIPLWLAGPIIRHCDNHQFTLWWFASEPITGSFILYQNRREQQRIPINSNRIEIFQVGTFAYIHLLQIQWVEALIDGQCYEYDLWLAKQATYLSAYLPELTYPGHDRFSFLLNQKINHLWYGSCRLPHHSSKDSFVSADEQLSMLLQHADRPSHLFLAGDQIYADDVATPLLQAIHQVISALELYDETFTESIFQNSQQLYQHPLTLNKRQQLLPQCQGKKWWQKFYRQKENIFTGKHLNNHLISFAEFIAMYALVWGSEGWRLVTTLQCPEHFSQKEVSIYQQQLVEISKFQQNIRYGQRLLAHIPTYMLFDDHDITDDWNLTAYWEKRIQEHSLAQQIIGNGLLAYWLCQGYGNTQSRFSNELINQVKKYCLEPTKQTHQQVIKTLYECEQWQYELNTSPKIIVIDSRTKRWQSEHDINKPSGLLNWEGLMELHQQIKNEQAVIIVTATPIFGVKIIESIQKMATLVGLHLAVDAENWMAHKGTASNLIQMFKQKNTAQNITILSGDVHYSFLYDISIRFRKNSVQLWQITCSGIKNHFPKWLSILAFLNRWLFVSYSPLNLFTRRRRLLIKAKSPQSSRTKQELINKAGLGIVSFTPEGRPKMVKILHSDGTKTQFL